MAFPIPMISTIPDFGSLYFVLFAGFGIALIIWIILWMLGSHDETSEVEEVNEKTEAKPVAEPKEAKEEPKEVKETASAELEEASDFEAATEEEAASLFSDELSSGLVKQDPVYGIIYSEAPDEVDDLKKIKGVAKVLEGKLHGIGVYRFKQVAVWTDAACAEFSKLLTFKNRIYQDNWIAQAKDFHKEKYDEEL